MTQSRLRGRWCLLFALASLTSVWSLTAAELHVSPQGNNQQPGTAQQPLATLTAAQNAIRVLHQKGRHETMTVWIHAGTYPQATFLLLGAEDTAAPTFDLRDNLVTREDLGFVAAAHLNFALRDNSMVYKNIPGFQKIP